MDPTKTPTDAATEATEATEAKKQKHSPGPWSMGHGNTDVIYTGSGTNRREVCTVAPPTTVHPDRPSYADSQLIAAAPELARDLYAALSWMEAELHGPDSDRARADYMRFRSTLEKAGVLP